MERLRQFLVDNEALHMFWNENKKTTKRGSQLNVD
jgi:hypothetical protein